MALNELLNVDETEFSFDPHHQITHVANCSALSASPAVNYFFSTTCFREIL